MGGSEVTLTVVACGEAPEQNVFLGVTDLPRSNIRVRMGDEFARADEVVVCVWLEAGGVGGIKAVSCSETEDGGCQESTVCAYGGLDGGWGFIPVRWFAGAVGGVV